MKKFWEQDPAGAASWLSEVASAAKNPLPALVELANAAKANATTDQLQQLVQKAFSAEPGLFDSVGSAIATAQAQNAGADAMGWAAAPAAAGGAAAPAAAGGAAAPAAAGGAAAPAAAGGAAAPAAAGGPLPLGEPTPANFVGYLQKNDKGEVQFKTATGTFNVDLSTTDWREEIETAFLHDRHGNPQLLTMKGFPSKDGTRIFAQMFAPGADPNFIAARAHIDGDRVFLATIGYGGEEIEVTHPEFKQLLKGDQTQGLANYYPAGLILPGASKTNPVTRKKTYDENPRAFFILGRTMKLNIGSDEKYDYHDLDTGYFKATGARSLKGMIVPDASKPGGAKWDKTDTSTHGSTSDQTGPRTFFYAKILPNNEKFPDAIKFPRPLQRRLEISAVGDQGDNGIHAPLNGSPVSNDFGVLGKNVPASAPEYTQAQGTIDPADD